MPGRTILGLVPHQSASNANADAPPSLLHIEDQRGGQFLCVRFDSVSAWQQQISTRGAEGGLGIQVYLLNGDTVSFLQVAFDFFTEAMREHSRGAFGAEFLANDHQTAYVRRAHIHGFSTKQGHTVYLSGGHQLDGLRVNASDLSSVQPMVRQQPEPAPQLETPHTPSRQFPVYSCEQTYSVGNLVLHEGSLYRRESRSANLGSPTERPEDWQYVSTLAGQAPESRQISKATGKQDIAEYSDQAKYGFGDLVRFKGAIYRKLTRNTSGGRPDQTPHDWDCTRLPATLERLHA